MSTGCCRTALGCRPTPSPASRMLTDAISATNVASVYSQVNIATTAIVDTPVQLSKAKPGQAEIVSDRPGRIEIRASAPTAQLLVLSESFHSGWNVRVNGIRVAVFRAYSDYMGCLVGAGVSNVLFTFEPADYKLGYRISICGLIVIMLWSIASATGVSCFE